jgi:hypothetical protein
MATFYLRTRTGLACKKAGQSHALYIAGLAKYKDKTEVQFVIDKNLPVWASNADDFFTKADENERANGRSFRSIVFAIPYEATHKEQWAQDFTQTLLGDRHAYRLAVHIPLNWHNPHAHLMFTERMQSAMSADTYFSRKNAKEKAFSGSKSKQWLEGAKRQYLALIRRLCPDYTPPNAGEPKIGQALPFSTSIYEDKRQARIAEVERLRCDTQELQIIERSLAKFISIPTDDYLLPELFQQVATGGLELNYQKFTPSSRSIKRSFASSQIMPIQHNQPTAPRPKFR